MTRIRTFYWHDRVKGRTKTYWRRYVRRKESAWNDFIVGNAGDIFARNLMTHFYPDCAPLNTSSGPRILPVGSIGHKLQEGDVLSGIGCKSVDLPRLDPASISIHALRGPISYEAFKNAGYDVSGVAWLADPGLLIGKMVKPVAAHPGNVIFIPHYRERRQVRKIMPKNMVMVDIDDDPLVIAKRIMEAELVYTSSLHGVVFAHALNRPVVLVQPQTEEPLLKYEDYHLAVGLAKPQFLSSIAEAAFATAPTSPVQLTLNIDDIAFPNAGFLKDRGIIV